MSKEKRKIIAWCNYCKCPIYEGEGMTIVNGSLVHYNPDNPSDSCYFPGEEEEDE